MVSFLPRVGILLVLAAATARGQVIDNFSTADSSNYNAVLAYQSGAASPAGFAVSSGQLVPTGGAGNTTIFLRNTGQSLSDTVFGESVSLDLVGVSNPATDNGSQLGADSIGFSDSLPPSTPVPVNYSSQDAELGILRDAGGYAIASSNTSVVQAATPIDANFSLGSITETITRVADNNFTLNFSGPGLVGSPVTITNITMTIAPGHTLYFGPDVFEGNTVGDQVVDNLAFVPEPSTYAMLLGGVALLVLVGRARTLKRA
jgi:hypothetical protein